MAQKVFRSKVDEWLRVLLIAISVMTGLIGIAVYQSVPGTASEWLVLMCFGVAGLVLWTLNTVYIVDRRELRIRSGPFRWRIPIAEITQVNDSRLLLSGPALSLDRLLIRAGKRVVLVSPEDKIAFRRALGK
jgi:hypothetical protein